LSQTFVQCILLLCIKETIIVIYPLYTKTLQKTMYLKAHLNNFLTAFTMVIVKLYLYFLLIWNYQIIWKQQWWEYYVFVLLIWNLKWPPKKTRSVS